MARASFSIRAKEDLIGITAFTLHNWGEQRAIRYLNDLEACAEMLARNPRLGRKCDWIRPGLMRMECGRHVLFYRRRRNGILVVRILHQRMMPEGRLREDPEP